MNDRDIWLKVAEVWDKGDDLDIADRPRGLCATLRRVLIDTGDGARWHERYVRMVRMIGYFDPIVTSGVGSFGYKFYWRTSRGYSKHRAMVAIFIAGMCEHKEEG